MLSDDEQLRLIAQAVDGDRFALQQLLLVHGAWLSRHVVDKLPMVLRGTVDVEDILQQTYLQACRDIRTLSNRTVQSFSTWLRTVAENRIRDALRSMDRKKRQARRRDISAVRDGATTSSMADLVEMLSDRADTPGRCAVRHEAIQAVQVGVAGLCGEQREAIRLHCLEGRTLAETAATMNRTPGAVRGLLQRAKQELRDVLHRSSLWLD